MGEKTFSLHDSQLHIANSPARFKVVAAGRRFGKSYLSAIMLLIEALKKEHKGKSLKDKRVFYVAPTFDQGKRIIWDLLKDLGHDFIKSTLENQGIITLKNDRKIEIKGADRPDTLRGVGLSYVVLDEFAFMKPDVWEQIIRPTLADVEGGALFIGTPDGKNHFYELFKQCATSDDWEGFSFKSSDNPTLASGEIEHARNTMSTENFRQEFEANFSSGGGSIFKESQLQFMDEEPYEGSWYVVVDPAGFADVAKARTSKLKRLDECAIVSVKVGPYGWYVGNVDHGRWGIRETSLRILKNAKAVHAVGVGIEKGALKNAIMPYLYDQMRRLNTFFSVHEVTHGGKNKNDRITWALQGRFEHGRIFFKRDAEWIKAITEQLLDFPNPMAHDDLIDALSYVDQIATTLYETEMVVDTWEPLDSISGF